MGFVLEYLSWQLSRHTCGYKIWSSLQFITRGYYESWWPYVVIWQTMVTTNPDHEGFAVGSREPARLFRQAAKPRV